MTRTLTKLHRDAIEAGDKWEKMTAFVNGSFRSAKAGDFCWKCGKRFDVGEYVFESLRIKREAIKRVFDGGRFIDLDTYKLQHCVIGECYLTPEPINRE